MQQHESHRHNIQLKKPDMNFIILTIIWSSKTGKTNVWWQKSEQWLPWGKWLGGYKRETRGTDNILCFDLCGTGCVHFVKGSADLCSLYIFTDIFYFNKKVKGGREREKRVKRAMEERWEGEKKKADHNHGQWIVSEGFWARKWQCFMKAFSWLCRIYWRSKILERRTNWQTIVTIPASKSPDTYL